MSIGGIEQLKRYLKLYSFAAVIVAVEFFVSGVVFVDGVTVAFVVVEVLVVVVVVF